MSHQVEAKRVFREKLIAAYFKGGGLERASEMIYYSGLNGPRDALMKADVLLPPPGRPSVPLLTRELIWALHRDNVGPREITRLLATAVDVSESSVSRILARRKEKKSEILGVALALTDPTGRWLLVCRELENWNGYKQIGDWSVPMGKRRNGKKSGESATEAFMRMVQRELFATREGVSQVVNRWEEIFSFLGPPSGDLPFDALASKVLPRFGKRARGVTDVEDEGEKIGGCSPMGYFWIGDARVALYRACLMKNPGFNSYTVGDHSWVDPRAVVAGQLNVHFRPGALEMIKVFADYQSDPSVFQWGEEYDT